MGVRLPTWAGLTIAILHVVEMLLGAFVQIYTAREICKCNQLTITHILHNNEIKQ